MRPLRDEARDELERQASDLLTEASDRPVWTPKDKGAVWRGIVARAGERERALGPRLGWPLSLALAGSFALLAFALVHTRARPRSQAAAGAQTTATVPQVESESSWSDIDLGAVGTLRVARKTVYRLPAAPARDYRIVLEEGTLCAEITHRDAVTQGPLLIQTPQFQVVVIGTSFCVDVHGGISRVSVTQGRVQVQAPTGTAFVNVGETMGSDDPRLRPARPVTPPAKLLANSSPVRPSMPQPAQPAAAQAALPPSSLAEQNALYSQGTLARDRHDGPGALAAWSSFLHQFPQGVLAPEAAAGVLGELVEEGRDREALTAADDFLVRFPANGRAAEVAFIRGNLLREKLGRTADALVAYQQALGLATRPRLKDDALFAVGACQRMLGQTAAARETFKRYQAQFPNGVHSGELSRWLSETR